MRHKRDVHTLAGPYAMDAISAPDRARFDRHLARCEDCAREIASLREATARLAAAAAVSPPPALKARVMAAAAATRQRPPAAGAGGGGPRLAGVPRQAGAGGGGRGRGCCSRGGGGVRGQQRQHARSAQPGAGQQIAAVLTARDATMMTGAVRGGGTVTIVMSHARRELVFTAADLHALPDTPGYELWLIGPAGDRAVIMLRRSATA
jgi:anti-sigma factor RsiW